MAKVNDPGYGHEKSIKQGWGHEPGIGDDVGEVEYRTGIGEHHDGFGSTVDTGKEIDGEAKHEHDLAKEDKWKFDGMRTYTDNWEGTDADARAGFVSLGSHDPKRTDEEDGFVSTSEIGGSRETHVMEGDIGHEDRY
jgi:hypothetical protein